MRWRGPGARAGRLGAVLLLALLVRLANLAWIAGQPISDYQRWWRESDMAVHWTWSDRILAGDLLGRDTYQPETGWMAKIAPPETWQRWRGGAHVFNKAPLYPYTLAAMRWLVGDGFWPIALCQLAWGLAAVALAFLVAERCFGLVAATAAGTILALYGPLLLHETLLLRDALGTMLSLLLLYAILRAGDDGPRAWLVAGLAFALGLLGRELTLLFGPLVMLWMFRRLRRPAAARAFVAFVAGIALGLAPLAARNIAVGAPPWAFSGLAVEGIVYGHSADSAAVGFRIPRSAPATLRAADGHLGRALRLTLATYEGNWGRLARHEIARSAGIFASYEAADNTSWDYFVDHSLLLRLALRWEMVLALGLIGIALARGRSDDRHLLCYFVLTALAGLQFAPLVGRYRLVPAAGLAVYAGWTVAWLVAALRARRWRAVLGVAVAGVVIIAVSRTLLPTHAARGRFRATEFQLAAQVWDSWGQPKRAYDDARRGLETVYAGADQPKLPPGYLALARGLVHAGPALGREAATRDVLRRLAARYPADPAVQEILRTSMTDPAARPH